MQANTELRMSVYRKHVAVCEVLGVEKPLDWHTWKFKVWSPTYASMRELSKENVIDAVVDAVCLASKFSSNTGKMGD